MSPFATKHKRFSSTTLQQLFFTKLSIYLRDVLDGQVFAIRRSFEIIHQSETDDWIDDEVELKYA